MRCTEIPTRSWELTVSCLTCLVRRANRLHIRQILQPSRRQLVLDQKIGRDHVRGYPIHGCLDTFLPGFVEVHSIDVLQDIRTSRRRP